MAANTALSVSSLDFDEIRGNLRNFIAAKPEFRDFDFEDSAIGTLLDLLAYNTYYNSFYTNMAASESFLDSAQFYDNVVSRAKMIGYTPISARGATANVRIRFSSAVATPSNPTLTIAKNTKFTSSINGVSYTFVTPQSYTISGNSTNRFQQDIDLVEGYPLTHRFAFTTSNTAFILPNDNVDTRSVTVTVTTNGTDTAYVQADDILVVNSSSKIFYLEGDRSNRYKLSFGDDILGDRPDYNSTVAITYRVCNALKGNGANNFVAASTVAGESSFTLTVNERASGGAEQESIASIKFTAPKSYETQNRGVVSSDYQQLILRNNQDLQAVSVWGGEENNPPVYGKVYASVKPYQGTLISTSRKRQIESDLKRYNVGPIGFVIVDPTFLYIVPTVTVVYDSTFTTKTPSEIAALVAARIISFETNNFNRFGTNFYYSKFLTYLDRVDDSIVGSSAAISLQKRFAPNTSGQNTYTFDYNTSLSHIGNQATLESIGTTLPGFGTITSTGFTYQGFTSFLEDDGFGNIRTYYSDGTNGDLSGKVYTNYTAGLVDYDTGLLTLSNFFPTAFSGDEMRINVSPVSPNVTAVRNQLLFFADASVNVVEVNNRNSGSSVTTIATAGESETLNETGLVVSTY